MNSIHNGKKNTSGKRTTLSATALEVCLQAVFEIQYRVDME